MKAVFIGSNPKIQNIAFVGIGMRWPDATLQAAETAVEGLGLVERVSPDVVLLHPDFTDIPPSQTIREIREVSNAPLLVLGCLNNEIEAVSALEAGADDYARLPCDLTEIMARVWALLRRTDSLKLNQIQQNSLRIGALLVNLSTYEAHLNRKRLLLTSTEFRLLRLLARNHGIVIKTDSLRRGLWGDSIQTDASSVKKYVQRLRRKLGDDAKNPRWIVTIRGVGYKFIGPPPSQAAEHMAV